MSLLITKNEIVSSSELVKNFSKLRKKVKENSRLIIFKNNKPDLVLIDFNQYEKLLEQIDTMEDILISKTIEERDKEDDQVRYSFDDIKALAQKHITKQNFYQALYEYEVKIINAGTFYFPYYDTSTEKAINLLRNKKPTQ